METLRLWLDGVSRNPLAQLMILGRSFVFLTDGASGFGTPAALAAPILVGLGFPPVRIAALRIVMNTVLEIRRNLLFVDLAISEALDAVDAGTDLVLADITLPGKSGLELIKDIKAIHPRLPTLVISMHDESLYAERVLRAGGAARTLQHWLI
jgi:CheY-like chemotaxis protein